MIFSFCGVHSLRRLGAMVSEVDLLFVYLILLVWSIRGKGGLSGGIEVCLLDIQVSSVRGFRTDLEGWCWTPSRTPAEL